jgi:hypothetical protein
LLSTEAVHVQAHGNLIAATAFLSGRVFEEMEASELDQYDASYPVILAARAKKSIEI